MENSKSRDRKADSYIRRELGILSRQLGYKRQFPDPNLVKVIVPTLSYEALDCTGQKILPWALMKLFDSCELGKFWPLRDSDSDPSDVGVYYILNCELHVDYSFYLLESPKFPLVIENRVKFVKKTSRCIEQTLLHCRHEMPYAVMSTIGVNMDPELRVPKPFPSWWKDHFKFPDQGERREFQLPPKPSISVFASQYQVGFSDTDENKHTNYTVYVRMAFNSMCEHILAGNYGKGLDVYEMGLKTLQGSYLSDSRLGDVLIVSSWASDETKYTFYFELHNGNTLCATLSMCFYYMLDKKRSAICSK